jgi:F5/8 type C domain-containing protein/cell wall-active antibiotic response 4TMS protein YvqF
MASRAERHARAVRQERVSKAVWGLLFIAMGALLIMEDRGDVDLGQPSDHPASHAVDGDPDTRWSSAFRDNQWIEIDLGAPADITRVKLVWEKAFATHYQILASSDGTHWTTVKDVTEGKGGTEEHNVDASGRYVRVQGLKRATPWGISLYEVEVYGTEPSPGAAPSSPHLLSAGKKATASSLERMPVFVSYWFIYWPVLLIAGGLPLLVAPKDNGEQVFGLLLTGIGVYILLQKLGRIPWTLAQSWPVLLVVAGFLLVTQALGQKKDESDDGRPSPGGGSTGGTFS